MSTRTLVAGALLALTAVSCSCDHDEADDARRRSADAMETPATPTPPAPEDTAALADVQALETRRATALRDAGGVVQRYLTFAGGADWKAADALWAYRRTPSASEEAGIRTVLPARAMRVQSGPPRPLDAEPVPAYVEVPVKLRIDQKEGPQLRYTGWYRLRRNGVEQEWELIAASLSPEIR